MELLTPPPHIAHAGLRALNMVARRDGQLSDLERRMFNGVQAHILDTSYDVDALEPITALELAATVEAPMFRERILSACLVMALIDGDASQSEAELLDEFAAALEIESHALADVKRIIASQLLVARIDIARRSFIGQRGRAYLKDQGIAGLARTLRALFGIRNAALAERYRDLQYLAPGTLGREYYEFIRANGFSLPGEPNGAPEVIVFHDCLHVLAGYGTSSIEETQIASFQAGVLRKDPIFGLLFMLAQFHIGVQITPVTGAERLVADPELMLQAFARGAKTTRDLCVDWVPQKDFERSVEELRREYNVVPR